MNVQNNHNANQAFNWGQAATQFRPMNPFMQGGMDQPMLGLLLQYVTNNLQNRGLTGGFPGANQPFGQGQQAGMNNGAANQAFGGFPRQVPALNGGQRNQLAGGLQQLTQQLTQLLGQIMQQGFGQGQQAGMNNGAANQAFGQGQQAGVNNGAANQPFGQGGMNNGAANQAFGQGAMNANAKDVKYAAKHGGYKWQGDNRVNFTKGQFKGGHGMVDGKCLRVYDKNGQHVANQAIKKQQHGKAKVASPLTFDLNGNGKVDTTGVNKNFDINGDGKVDKTAWAGKGDGVLAFDRDGDGKFGEDGTELFGNNTNGQNKYANGFEALKAFAEKRLGKEAVADGKLDKKELAALGNDLRMKVDGKDVRLSELGIDEISLGYEEAGKNADANGNQHRQTGGFKQNGESKKVDDVWFKYQ